MKFIFHVSIACLVAASASHAAGDAKRGAQVFRQCMACHSVAEDEHMTGPSLAHVWKHKAGTVPGFQRYSEAMKRSTLLWDEATLDKWLVNPTGLVPGTAMTFPGLKEEKDRLDVIAYLRAVAENKAPPQGEMKGGMMGMQGRKPDLHKAPAEAQVKAIRYCGDTYTVETADGKSEKVWEFNLRFKTDSSKLGPAPGKPVAIGAGMQGDRSSIVFASPKEIAAFIKLDCP
jgi:cytochrome c